MAQPEPKRSRCSQSPDAVIIKGSGSCEAILTAAEARKIPAFAAALDAPGVDTAKRLSFSFLSAATLAHVASFCRRSADTENDYGDDLCSIPEWWDAHFGTLEVRWPSRNANNYCRL